MKRLFTLILSISSGFLLAQTNAIKPVEKVKTGYTSFVFQLDNQALQAALKTAPLEGAESRGLSAEISLPMPNGKMVDLAVIESPIIAPELAAKYPAIKSYKVSGNGYSGRIGYTYKGFHGMIFTPEGTVYIDPLPNQSEVYHSYNRNDYTRFYEFTKGHQCLVEGEEYNVFDEIGEIPATAQNRSGEQLRTYRLALACTGEYAQFHGGTVSGALSAMVVTMNRVNGVYEREFSITMQIIGNNDQLIYLNGSTDPYTNNSGGTMLGENQSNVNSVIGSANYDIGHVFSTGGGGIASLGSVCNFSTKAAGVTGGNSPVGDPFDIDYVAHEMGHQFGANHTQNNNCNRNSSTAFEPGSASTIMGYAGICPPNLQSNSDDYFHAGSYDEVIAFSQFANGNTCASTTNTGNTAPVATAFPGGFTIPKETPFVLRGTATDADGDDLTYCWEQMDLGGGSLTNPIGNAPIFRSWDPEVIGERTCPKLINVIIGNTPTGEMYATYSRDLTFRMTVRDHNSAGGGVDYDEVAFEVDGNKGPFEVITPSSNIQVEVGTNFLVEWDVAQTDQAPINCQNVHILLCNNNGLDIIDTLAANVPNTGSYLAPVDVNTATGSGHRVRVEAADNIFFNLGPSNFTLVPQTAPAYEITLTAAPDFLTGSIELNWTDSFNNENFFVIERSVSGNGNFVVIDTVPTNTVMYNDSNVSMYGTAYVYRVYAGNQTGNSNYSNEAGYEGVGIDEFTTSNFSVYPNPAKNTLNVSMNNEFKATEAKVFNVQSQVVKSVFVTPGTTKVDITELSAGSYFINLNIEGKEVSIPFQVID